MKVNKKSLLAVALIGMLVLGSGYGTYAYFTARAVSADNTIKAGTLKLGGVRNGEDVEKQFATVTFKNIEPGETLQNVATTKLKNVGDLPFYLYRITASDLVDNTTGENDNGKTDTILDKVLTMNITIDEKQVYHGKLSELKAINGGYFDPIQEIESKAEKNMKISLSMDSNAGNEYQGLSMSCDFTVYAAQQGMPISGESEGTKYDMGSTELFSVEGWNDGEYIYFQWHWIPEDKDKEAYKIKLKHQTGNSTTQIKEVRCLNSIDDSSIYSLNGITRDYVEFYKSDNIIRIDKNAIPQEWKTFEIQLGGSQVFSESDYQIDIDTGIVTDNIDYKTIPYQQWSLNR